MVIDVNLPGADGFEGLRMVRLRHPRIRTVMLTSRDAEDDVVRGFDLGVDEYITKPFRPAEFVARLRRLLPKSGHAS
jgi:DNA-binding response OmpR family regulator